VDVPAGLTGARDELGEPGANPGVLERPGDHLLEGRGHGRELPRDHLAQREPALVETVLHLLVYGRVAEFLRGAVEQIGLRDRTVVVEHDRPTH
jgi:hypothetical protein